MADIRLKLSPPWVTYVNELKALFGGDPDIKIEYVDKTLLVKIFVDNARKAAALDQLLPCCKVFGTVSLDIAIIPSNEEYNDYDDCSIKELFDIAFERNPAYAYTREVTGVFDHVFTYVVFKNKVVQFFNDNLNDVHGLMSTLYEEIARDIFGNINLISTFFNTDIEEKVGMPLGEWP